MSLHISALLVYPDNTHELGIVEFTNGTFKGRIEISEPQRAQIMDACLPILRKITVEAVYGASDDARR